MIEIDPTPAGFYVRLGPFQTEAQAKAVRELLVALSVEARMNAGGEPFPLAVARAVDKGLQCLDEGAGHFTLRVNGGSRNHKAELSADVTYRDRERPGAGSV